MFGSTDTIAALSSGALPSGVAIIRLSGPRVRDLLEMVAGGVPEPRRLTLRSIGGKTPIDRGLVAFFAAPQSFTGEDCAELQVHGSPAGIRAILRLLVSQGARLAEAGEFTRRAFENGKLDLTEIEGLGDLLEAETENQRRQALARLEGGLTRRVESWRLSLLDLRAQIEANLDFSDEGDVPPELSPSFQQDLGSLGLSLQNALATIAGGRIVREGIRVALAGAPNVGKSSLINALSRSDVAIVTDEAGTTRDVREVPLEIAGQLFILLDLAGLRQTQSKAEAEGIRRAREAIASADILIWMTAPDVEQEVTPAFSGPILHVASKSDLGAEKGDLAVSANTGEGVQGLLDRLAQLGETLGSGEPGLLSRERDREALQSALTGIVEAEQVLHQPELAAESLRQASVAFERLVGRIDSEQVLDRLFSAFCIGK